MNLAEKNLLKLEEEINNIIDQLKELSSIDDTQKQEAKSKQQSANDLSKRLADFKVHPLSRQ